MTLDNHRSERAGTRRPHGLTAMLAAACLCASVGSASAQGSVADDRAALEALYRATDGDNWEYRTDWLTGAPLRDWYGIETDTNGRVTVVSLTRNGLKGQIPSDLEDLDRLEELWLTANELTGQIPPALGNLTRLEVLSLGANRLNGPIPDALRNLTSLEQLNVNDNALSGSIPPVLADLSGLVDLSFDDNALSGPIPAGLGSLSGLKWVDFTRNELTGTIPSDLAGLPGLLRLRLGSNALNGSIPPALGSLGSLVELSLADNDLAGAVPERIEDLTALEFLYLDGNSMLTGPLPLRLMFLAHLVSVDIRNTQLCGPDDTAFRTWAASIDFQGCGGPASPPPSGGGGGGGGGSAGVHVSFAHPAYAAAEGEPGVPVTVILSAVPRRPVTLALTTRPGGGATAADYTLERADVTFESRTTEAAITVTAVDDATDDDGEFVVIGFGPLTGGVTVGDPAVATVTLADNDVTASFGRPAYLAAEGGPPVRVAVRLNASPGREVTIPLAVTPGGGATAADYTLRPETITFGTDATEAAVEVRAAADAADDDGESVSVGFGPLEHGVIAGSPTAATVSIADAGGPGFTDELSAGGPVRAVHLTELRLRIDALRRALGSAPFGWDDAVIEPGVTPVRAAHLTELRDALAEAYALAGQTPPRYSAGAPGRGTTPIRADHFIELRNAVVALERR